MTSEKDQQSRRAQNSTTVPGPLFVVGASRSGTQVLRSALNRHPDIHLAGETHYLDDLRVRLGDRASEPLDHATRHEVEDYFLPLSGTYYDFGGDPDASPMSREQLRQCASELGGSADDYFEAFCRLAPRTSTDPEPTGDVAVIWGEKTPRHVFRIDDILARWPAARVIVMVRDPRAVVASYRDWQHKSRRPDQVRRLRASYDASVVSLLWRATVAAGQQAVRRHGPDRVRMQSFETLVTDPESSMRDLSAWLGVDFAPTMLDVPLQNSTYSAFSRSAGFQRSTTERWRDRLDRREVATVQHWCAESMRQFDYALEDVRLGPLGWVLMMARLIVAVPRAGIVNRRRMGRVGSYILRRARMVIASGRSQRVATGSSRVVVGGQIPPPQSGQHVAVERLIAQLEEDQRLRVEHLPYRFAETMTGHGRPSLLKVLSLMRLLGRVLALSRRGRVDMFVHPVSGPGSVAAVKDAAIVAAARVASRRVVLQFHGGGHGTAWADPTPLQRVLIRVLGSADAAVVHADVHRRDPERLGIDRIEVVPHWIPDRRDLDLREPADGLVRVLYVGHLGPHRGTPALARCVRDLARDGFPVELTLVGAPAQGWTDRDLATLLEVVRGAPIRHRGELSGRDLDRVFASADVFAFPSTFVAETFGLVLVEALMWGLPIVASDWGAAREVLAGANLEAVLHPVGPDLEARLREALEDVVGRVASGAVAVPSTANRRWYEDVYREPSTAVADLLVEVMGGTRRSARGDSAGRRAP